ILCALVFWATARGWQLWLRGGTLRTFDLGPHALLLPGATRTSFVRVIAVVLLLGFAGWTFLGNFELLFNSHAFMTGADYVDEKAVLPLRWLLIAAALIGIPLVWTRRYRMTVAALAAVYGLMLLLPVLIRAVYV